MFRLVFKNKQSNIIKYKLNAFKKYKWNSTLSYISCEYVFNVSTKKHLFF